jgi:ABC-2 type transport system ATP-binding protein
METTNTTYMQDRYVESLSHGMQQRVGIARTLLHDPEVLILDEPANGLDPKARIEMRQLLLQLAAQGKTLIVTSHILPELSRICNVVAIVTAGKLRAFGSVDDVMSKLCPQRNFEIQVASAEHMPSAERLLRDVLLDTEPLISSPAELMLRFPTVRSEVELAELLQKLVAAKLPVTQFRELTSDLEDAFLSVAGKE